MATGGPPGGSAARREAGGAAWAQASARTLARRLRRRYVETDGVTRCQAVAYRVGVFRRAILRHWQIADAVGCHAPTLREMAAAAAVLRVKGVDIAETHELNEQANWARHAPGPGGRPVLRPLPAGLTAVELENFRADLYAYGVEEKPKDVTPKNQGVWVWTSWPPMWSPWMPRP